LPTLKGSLYISRRDRRAAGNLIRHPGEIVIMACNDYLPARTIRARYGDKSNSPDFTGQGMDRMSLIIYWKIA